MHRFKLPILLTRDDFARHWRSIVSRKIELFNFVGEFVGGFFSFFGRSFFGVGLSVFVFDNGGLVASSSFTPAWGGVGDEWFDITTDGGSVFDEVRILGFGFDPTTFVDNLSWNAVPEPGSLLLLIGGMSITLLRRRR